jgi:hypothetical protein
MVSKTTTIAFPSGPVELWPPDDTEQSVAGTDLHQMTIMNMRWGINEIARVQIPPGGPAPWQALSQTIVTGFQRPDGTRYKTLPDVFVYRRPIGQRRGSVAISVDGPPALIVEVLSESTYESELDLSAGKGFSYARAGVREYIAIDPTGECLPERVRAWRLEDDAYQPWEPDAQGRWRSEEIAVAFGLEDMLATVYTLDGRRQLREGEISATLAERERTLTQQAAELAELRRRLAQLEGQHE